MSSAKFTEDGSDRSVEIKRLQYTISDTISFEDSGVLKKSIKVDIEGWMKRSEIKNYKIWSSQDGGETVKRNKKGTLVFTDSGEYMKIKDVYILSIEETSETWREWGQVKISFSNEGMDSSDKTVIKFRGSIDIYNAQLSITPSVLRKNSFTVPTWNGSFYQETGYDITRVVLNGIIPYDSCLFPESIISEFEWFRKDGDVMVPHEGDLSEFISGVDNLKIGNVFIENASLVWNIERKVIQVNVSFVGPHQDVK